MSVHVSSWVWKHPRIIKSGELIVALCLADFADDEGLCYPSLARISERTKMTERTVSYTLRRLEALRIITYRPGVGRGHRSVYRVNYDPVAQRGQNLPPFAPPVKRQSTTPKSGNPQQLKEEIHDAPIEEPSEEPSVEPPLSATAPPQAAGFHSIMLDKCERRGYVTDHTFLTKLVELYPRLNLEYEALCIADWLSETKNRQRKCSTRFILNWLAKADEARTDRAATKAASTNGAAPHVTAPPPRPTDTGPARTWDEIQDARRVAFPRFKELYDNVKRQRGGDPVAVGTLLDPPTPPRTKGKAQ